jgi:large subunit ribosomal protein L33
MSKKEGQTMAKKENRNGITLVCTVCGNENYRSQKNKKNDPDRIELNKFCEKCRKVTVHKEKK